MINDIIRVALKSKDGRYYKIQDETVISAESPAYLEFIPEEWAENEAKTARSRQFWGLFREYTGSLKFYEDGATIVRSLCYGGALGEAYCYIQVDRRDNETLAYSPFFGGELDLSQLNDVRSDTEDYIEAIILEGGVPALIRSNEDIEYEVPISGPDVLAQKITSLPLSGFSEWASVWPPDYYIVDIDSSTPALQGDFVDLPGHVFIRTESTIDVIEATTQTSKGAFAFMNKFDLFRVKRTLHDVRMSGSLTITLGNTSGVTANYELRLVKNNLTVLHTYASGSVANGGTASFTVDLAYEISGGLSVNDTIGLRFVNYDTNSNENTSTAVTFGDGHIARVDYKYYSDDIITKGCLRYAKVFESVIKQATNNTASVDLSFLNSTTFSYSNAPYFTTLTCGDSVRGLNTSPYTSAPNTYPVIKVKLSQLRQDMFARWGAGITISGNTVSVKPIHQLFNKDNVIRHLGEPVQVTRYLAKEYLANKVKVGSPAQTHDKLNGRDDAHTTQVYKLPVQRTVGEMDLTTPFYTSPYALFYTWADTYLFNTAKADNKNDNNIFVVDVNATPVNGYYTPYIPTGTVQGMEDPTHYFNYGETPKSCLYRHRRLLRSMLHGLDNETITYQTSDKNAALKTIFGGVTVDEDADIKVSDLGTDRIFIPVIDEIEIEADADLLADIDANPDGCFQYTHPDGYEVKLFPLDAGAKWGESDELTLVGLLTPDTILA